MTSTVENRHQLTGNNKEERMLREGDTRQLVHDIIGKHEEFFADPINRLDFIQSHDGGSFFKIAQYVNARLRSEKPHELRHREDEQGGFLPGLHVPSSEDKPEAFKRGYEAIQEYIDISSDAIEKKIEGAAMATEALIVWVHPFNDGNGRTSRFLAKLVEGGAVDMDSLVAETASASNRGRKYRDKVATKEGSQEFIDNPNILLDDDEVEQYVESAKNSPSDIEGMYISIKRLLENDSVRQNTLPRQKVHQFN